MGNIKIRCRGIIIHEEKLLLVKHSGGRDFLAFPGGHLDFGEDPVACMKRELVEELGVVPEIGNLLYVHTFVSNEESQSIEFFFEIKNGADFVLHGEKEKSHAYEIDEVVWFSKTDTHKILPETLGALFKEGKLGKDTNVTFLTV